MLVPMLWKKRLMPCCPSYPKRKKRRRRRLNGKKKAIRTWLLAELYYLYSVVYGLSIKMKKKAEGNDVNYSLNCYRIDEACSRSSFGCFNDVGLVKTRVGRMGRFSAS
jgi:hypothetical protein